MRAVIAKEAGPPEVMNIIETSLGEPGEQEVLIDIKAVGVNPVDTYLRAAAQGYSPAFPWRPGLDGAGTITAIGAGVGSLTIGTDVYVHGSITGTYAEKAIAQADRVFPLPAGLNFYQGASLGVPYFTALRALIDKGQVEKGQKILIHGASGGVGSASVQLALWKGLTVYGTAGYQKGIEALESLGARVVNHRDDDQFDKLKEASGDKGFDLILEMRADLNLDKDLKLLAPGGRVVVIGSRGSTTITPRDTMKPETLISGLALVNSTPSDFVRYAGYLDNVASEGKLKPLIDRVYPLEEAAQAHHDIIDKPHAGNIVLEL